MTAAIAAALLACGSTSGVSPPGGPGPGVVFGYPIDGQWDVPLRTQIVLRFSRPLPATVDAACTWASGRPSGAFCVDGPDGLVAGALKVDGAVLTFTPGAALSPGATYRVWARPALLPGATNLAADAPLVTFHARSTRTRPGEPATVLTLNGAPPAADGGSARPIHDVAPLRLVFSEPLDPATITTRTVRLVHVTDGLAIDGFVVASGIHLTFQPSRALTAGDSYRLEIGAAARDLGREAIAEVSLPFTPIRTAAPGEELYHLPMIVDPPLGAGAANPASPLNGMQLNTYAMSSTIDGDTVGGVIASGLDAFAGDPAAGPRLPLLIKRGGRMNNAPRSIPLGGVVETGNRTGVVHFTLLTDAFGFQMRNPFRGPGQEPDDAEAPTFLDLTMDAVVSSDDVLGNNISSQTILGMRILGLFRPENGELVCDQLASIDYQVFGLETAPITMALRTRTGGTVPAQEVGVPFLSVSTPLDGASDVPPGDPIELDFSGPLDPDSVFNDLAVTLVGSAAVAVPATARTYGTSLLIVPSRRLDEGTRYTLRWSGLRSVAGAALAAGSLSFTTAVYAAAQPVAPILLALLPGAPCALTGGTATSPGRCAGGQATDTPYLPFTLPANRDVRAYFSLPVDPDSLTLGAACGQGSVRVERVTAASGAGTCTGVVPGTLLKLDRELRFVPTAPWTPGAFYRVTLVGGPEHGRCAAGVICGRVTGLPLNTDPLNGFAGGEGGPDVVINFTAHPASAEVLQPLVSDGVADQNANGYVDLGEQENDRNRAMAQVADYSALFTDVTFTGASRCDPSHTGRVTCSYTSSALPSIIRGVVDHCPLDPQGNTSTMPYPCIETATVPGIVLQTTSAMLTESLYGLSQNSSDTGMRISRLIEAGGKPILGYIFNEPGLADPQFLMVQESYTDAPDLRIANTQHDLHSKRSRMVLKGPLKYRPDGRTQVSLRSLQDSLMTINLSTSVGIGPLAVPMSGSIDILTPAGEMRVTLTEPTKR